MKFYLQPTRLLFFTRKLFLTTQPRQYCTCAKKGRTLRKKNNYSKGKGHGNSIYVILCSHVLEEQDINLHLHNEIVHTKINSLSHRVVCRGYYRIYSMIK